MPEDGAENPADPPASPVCVSPSPVDAAAKPVYLPAEVQMESHPHLGLKRKQEMGLHQTDQAARQ